MQVAGQQVSNGYVLEIEDRGLGMTDDFDLGIYLKRARAAAERLGDTAYHQERWQALATASS